eukprot:jgi/Mesvir1/14485/Mv05189-RA.1
MAVRKSLASFLTLLLVTIWTHRAAAQLSDPISSDNHINFNNKFLQRQATADSEQIDEDVHLGSECPQGVSLRWMSEVSSSIYTTPLIADINSDGQKEVIVASFVHYLEVLDGSDGEKLAGWPAYHRSSVHSSPLLYDVDADGVLDVVLATYDGEVLFFRDSGSALKHKLVIPRLRVRRNWYVGLDPDPVDHHHADVGGDLTAPMPPSDEEESEEEARNGGGRAEERAGAGGHSVSSPHIDDGHPHDPETEHRRAVESKKPPRRQEGPLTFAQQQQLNQEQQQQQQQQQVPAVNEHRLPQGKGGESHPQEHAQPTTQPVQAQATVQGQETLQHQPQQQQLLLEQHAQPQQQQQQQEPHAQPQQAHTHQQEEASSVPVPEVAQQLPQAHAEPAQEHPAEAATNQVQGQAQGQPVHHEQAQEQQQQQQQQEQHHGTDAGILSTATHEAHQAALEAASRGVVPELVVADEGSARLPPKGSLGRDAGDASEDAASAAAATAAAVNAMGADMVGGAGGGDIAGAEMMRRRRAVARRRRLLQVDADGSGGGGGRDYGEDAGQPAGDEGGQGWNKEGGAEEGGEEEDDYDYYDRDADYYAGREHDDVYHDDSHIEELWDDEDWVAYQHRVEEGFTYVDAHVLCTPVIADIDKDGADELLVAASWFYDREYYDDPERLKELGKELELSKYIAGGIVAFDLSKWEDDLVGHVKWKVHLDLTTDQTQFRAYIYSSPTVVDLDGDGFDEILVGTSTGFIYALNYDGSPRENFPIQMGEIQGQVTAADINDDGYVEIVACDTRGNIAAFNWRGQELWERHVGSLIAQGATIGDVNGDGKTDVVVGTSSGHIFVLRGTDGTDVAPFPFRTHGKVMSTVLLIKLQEHVPQQQLVVTSFDGYVYIIDGATGCADTLDVGETSYPAQCDEVMAPGHCGCHCNWSL